MIPRVLTVCLCCLLEPVFANTLNQATVEFVDGIYQMSFDVEVNASRADVYRMLTDYEHLPQLNDMVIVSWIIRKKMESEPGVMMQRIESLVNENTR